MTAKLEDLLKPSQFLAKKLLIMIVKLTNSQSDLYTHSFSVQKLFHIGPFLSFLSFLQKIADKSLKKILMVVDNNNNMSPILPKRLLYHNIKVYKDMIFQK